MVFFCLGCVVVGGDEKIEREKELMGNISNSFKCGLFCLLLIWFYTIITLPPTLGGKKKLCGKRNDKCHKKETKNASDKLLLVGPLALFEWLPDILPLLQTFCLSKTFPSFSHRFQRQSVSQI